MSKPLVYLDQNIIGLQLSGGLRLEKRDDLVWVYSTEHLSEISRSSNADQYLAALEHIGAKFLRLVLAVDWKITGTAELVEGSPEQHYSDYMRTKIEVPVDETLFDPLVAWVNGGGDEDLLKQFPEKLTAQISTLIDTSAYDGLREQVSSLDPLLGRAVQQMIQNGSSITETRKALGVAKGRIGGIDGEDPIAEIWNIIGPSCGSLTRDQFFGFDPAEKQGYEAWPLYLGIVGCCGVLDILGFQSEKKCRRIEKIPNVRSDSSHIAMGAFCSMLLTEDKRLAKRAYAIYRHKNISTRVLLFRGAS